MKQTNEDTTQQNHTWTTNTKKSSRKNALRLSSQNIRHSTKCATQMKKITWAKEKATDWSKQTERKNTNTTRRNKIKLLRELKTTRMTTAGDNIVDVRFAFVHVVVPEYVRVCVWVSTNSLAIVAESTVCLVTHVILRLLFGYFKWISLVLRCTHTPFTDL